MPNRSYQLINPTIEGTFNDTYDASSPIKAAEKTWLSLSSHFVNEVPQFYMTLKEISGGGYHHFNITENGEKKSYNIKEIELDVKNDVFDNFLASIDTVTKARDRQTGGKPHRKRYDDSSSSSSSSSSSDEFPFICPPIRRHLPIGAFHYMPGIYSPPYTRRFTTLSPNILSPISLPLPIGGAFPFLYPPYFP